MSELEKALVGREDCSLSDAREIIDEMQDRISDGEMPDDVLYDYGLEPDYVFDLI